MIFDQFLEKAFDFIRKIKKEEKGLLFYHGDPDGLVAAFFFNLVLAKYSISFKNHWIGSWQFDFKKVRNLVKKENPNFLIFLDLAIDFKLIEELSSKRKIFIFDHHEVEFPYQGRNVCYLNPIFLNLKRELSPSYFSYLLFKKLKGSNLEWILSIGLLGERIANQYPEILEKAQKTVSKAFLKKMTELMMVNFINPFYKQISLNFLKKASQDLFKALESKEIKKLKEIRKAYLKEIEGNLKLAVKRANKEGNILFYKVRPICKKFFIAGPIASRLANLNPLDISFIYLEFDKKIDIELRRGKENKINLAKILSELKKRVPVISAGGHPMAAGALLFKKDFDKFKTEFQNLVK